MSRTSDSICIGRLFITASVVALVRNGIVNLLKLLERHAACDWGNVSDARKEMNDAAFKGGGQVVSRYEVTPTLTIVIASVESGCITRCMILEEFLGDDRL